MHLGLNRRAARLVDALAADAALLGVSVAEVGGAQVLDCGVAGPRGARGGPATGRDLPGRPGDGILHERRPGRPLAPRGDGRHRSSGDGLPGQPVRRLGHRPARILRHGLGAGAQRRPEWSASSTSESGTPRTADAAVLVLEGRTLPDERVVRFVADKCRVRPEGLRLLIAPTASIAGCCPGGRALGRDRAAQDAGARVRRPKRAERRGRVSAGAGGEERPSRHRLDQRLHPLRHPRLLRRPRG